jgi:hypothetical protein
MGAIARLAKQERHDEAVNFAIEAIKDYRDGSPGKLIPNGYDMLWVFMRLAIHSLPNCEDQKRWEDVFEIAKEISEPVENYFAAQSYCQFSLWKYETGDDGAAIQLAEIASRVDKTWGQPEFLLGLYCLVISGRDPMKHFTEAIRKDHRIIFRIANHPDCRQHPHIIHQLKSVAKDQIVTEGNGPGNLDCNSSNGGAQSSDTAGA